MMMNDEEQNEKGDSLVHSESNASFTSVTAEDVSSKSHRRKMMNAQSSSMHSSGMESSVFQFKNVNFVAGKGDKEKHLLKDVSGTVKWGHVLAVMGPSGAGKTTLISSLTLDAFYGKTIGSVTLNGVKLTDKVFKRHCFVVKQHDKHWPYLTCRETLQYTAELYDVAEPSAIPVLVEELIKKMGLGVCADTRCSRMSGGEARRLSIACALIKSPTLLFLDEPTSGLDAAAAENIMQEICRVAKEERLIIVASIHQPSTKIYRAFDKLMILSRGREAFSGNVGDAPKYFKSIGYPVPDKMNPAEHFLDLVNSDFSSEEGVKQILDTWEARNTSENKSTSLDDDKADVQEGVVDNVHSNFFKQTQIMFRRHAALVLRDPILYVGRCIMISIANTVFAFVYWKAREYDQSQAANKHFLNIWLSGVASNMGVVAVYALNDEFKSIQRECKNGMINPLSYALVKSVLVVPIIYIMSIFALAIPGLAIQDFPTAGFGQATLLWSLFIFCFECFAELLSVWIEDAIFGMMQFMNFWFACFLFSGNFLDSAFLYYPFELFYHILPFSYYLRSATYINLHDATWEPCVPGPDTVGQAVCVESGDPIEVLNSLSTVFGVVSSKDSVARDMVVILGIALIFKAIYLIGVVYKTSRVATIHSS